MYEDSLRLRPFGDRPRDWLRVFVRFTLCVWCAIGGLFAWASFAGFLTGCVAVPGATYGADKTEVAGRNAAAAVGFTGAGDNAPALLDALAALPGDLTLWGAPAVLAGAVLLSRPEAPNGLGFGLLCGGLLLLLCAAVLPLFCGWIGLGLVGATLAFYFLRKNPGTGVSPLNTTGATVSGLFTRLKSLVA